MGLISAVDESINVTGFSLIVRKQVKVKGKRYIGLKLFSKGRVYIDTKFDIFFLPPDTATEAAPETQSNIFGNK